MQYTRQLTPSNNLPCMLTATPFTSQLQSHCAGTRLQGNVHQPAQVQRAHTPMSAHACIVTSTRCSGSFALPIADTCGMAGQGASAQRRPARSWSHLLEQRSRSTWAQKHSYSASSSAWLACWLLHWAQLPAACPATACSQQAAELWLMSMSLAVQVLGPALGAATISLPSDSLQPVSR